MTTSASSMLDAALEYARRGVPVFPIWGVEHGRCRCGRADCENPGKHPLGALVPHGLNDATTDEALIRTWWERKPTANIATPASWCVVLDVDPRKGGDVALAELERRHGALPETAEVLTGGGGRHVYFAPQDGVRCNNDGKVGDGLDIKAPGGYVLLPPSTHVSGRTYQDEILHPLFDTPLAPMPAWLLALATTPSNNGHQETEATDWGALLTGAPDGQRHAIALRIAGHLLGKRLAPAEVEQILLGYAARCSPAFDVDDVRRIVRDLATKDAQRVASAPNGGPPPPRPEPMLICLADVTAEPVEWCWPRRVARGKLTLVIGEPGAAKTRLTHDVTARITRGLEWPDGGQAPRGSVLLMACEDGLADTVRPSIERQGGDPARVHVLRAIRLEGHPAPVSLDRDLDVLDRVLTELQAVALVVDPISAYLGAKDSYKDSEIRGVLDPLAALAERHHAAVVAVLHLTKAAQRKLLLRAQGSIAFVAVARIVLAVGEDPEHPGRRLVAPVKNNLGAPAPVLAFWISDRGLEWEPAPVEGTAERLLAGDEPATRTEQRERDSAIAFLRQVLAEGPVASKQIEADAKANGIAQRTLWRAKAELGIQAERGKAQGVKPSVWYWMLPQEPLW